VDMEQGTARARRGRLVTKGGEWLGGWEVDLEYLEPARARTWRACSRLAGS